MTGNGRILFDYLPIDFEEEEGGFVAVVWLQSKKEIKLALWQKKLENKTNKKRISKISSDIFKGGIRRFSNGSAEFSE